MPKTTPDASQWAQARHHIIYVCKGKDGKDRRIVVTPFHRTETAGGKPLPELLQRLIAREIENA
jgi:hypothetical protein